MWGSVWYDQWSYTGIYVLGGTTCCVFMGVPKIPLLLLFGDPVQSHVVTVVSSNVCVTCCRDHYMVSSPLTTVLTRPFKWSYISSCQFVGVWFGLVVVQWFFSECVTRCRDHCKPASLQPFSLKDSDHPLVSPAPATRYHHSDHFDFDSEIFWQHSEGGAPWKRSARSWHNILCSSRSIGCVSWFLSPLQFPPIHFKKRRRQCFEEDSSTVCLACRSAIRQRHSHTRQNKLLALPPTQPHHHQLCSAD